MLWDQLLTMLTRLTATRTFFPCFISSSLLLLLLYPDHSSLLSISISFVSLSISFVSGCSLGENPAFALSLFSARVLRWQDVSYLFFVHFSSLNHAQRGSLGGFGYYYYYYCRLGTRVGFFLYLLVFLLFFFRFDGYTPRPSSPLFRPAAGCKFLFSFLFFSCVICGWCIYFTFFFISYSSSFFFSFFSFPFYFSFVKKKLKRSHQYYYSVNQIKIVSCRDDVF